MPITVRWVPVHGDLPADHARVFVVALPPKTMAQEHDWRIADTILLLDKPPAPHGWNIQDRKQIPGYERTGVHVRIAAVRHAQIDRSAGADRAPRRDADTSNSEPVLSLWDAQGMHDRLTVCAVRGSQ